MGRVIVRCTTTYSPNQYVEYISFPANSRVASKAYQFASHSDAVRFLGCQPEFVTCLTDSKVQIDRNTIYEILSPEETLILTIMDS